VNARLRFTVIAVADLPRALRFYRSAFDWQQIVDEPHYAELALPGGARLGLVESAAAAARIGVEAPALPEAGVASGWLYVDVDDVEAATHRLIAAGARVLSGSARRDWGDECAFVVDPSGNVLALAHGVPAVDEIERLRALTLRWLKLWQRGDLADFDALHAPDFIDNSPSGRAPDRDGFRQALVDLYKAFPDFDLLVEELVVQAAERKVAVRWSATGTHSATFLGVAATGRTIVFRGLELVHIERDRIVERWGDWDGRSILEQLGVTLPPRSG